MNEPIVISCDQLTLSFEKKGAQLTSVKTVSDNRSLLWDGNAWPWHAPILYPVVGSCKEDQIIISDTAYPMKRHGFARQADFILVSHTRRSATFSLASSEETKNIFPFDFELVVEYELAEQTLKIRFKVLGKASPSLLFSLGYHPAFVLDAALLSSSAYSIVFEGEPPLYRLLLDMDGLLTGEKESVYIPDGRLQITETTFERDALIFENIVSKVVHLEDRSSRLLSMDFSDFKHLGIWSKPGCPFVCIEPLLGLADTAGLLGEFSEKLGIHELEKGHVFEAVLSISFF